MLSLIRLPLKSPWSSARGAEGLTCGLGDALVHQAPAHVVTAGRHQLRG